jgi:hypothetical protein
MHRFIKYVVNGLALLPASVPASFYKCAGPQSSTVLPGAVVTCKVSALATNFASHICMYILGTIHNSHAPQYTQHCFLAKGGRGGFRMCIRIRINQRTYKSSSKEHCVARRGSLDAGANDDY